MSKEKMRIEVQYSTDGLFGSTDPAEYDEQASIAQFGEALTNHLYEAYPNAEITVTASIIDSVRVNGRADRDEAELIVPIVEKVWNGDDWLVGK